MKIKTDRLVLFLVMSLVLLIASTAGAATQLPDVTLKTINGGSLSLNTLKGKVVLVNFFASWCLPCNAEMPDLVELEKQHKKEGLAVVGLALEPPSRLGIVKEFLKTHKVAFPVALAGKKEAGLFGGVSALPTSLLVDRQGVIVRRYVGMVPKKSLESAVKTLLAD